MDDRFLCPTVIPGEDFETFEKAFRLKTITGLKGREEATTNKGWLLQYLPEQSVSTDKGLSEHMAAHL